MSPDFRTLPVQLKWGGAKCLVRQVELCIGTGTEGIHSTGPVNFGTHCKYGDWWARNDSKWTVLPCFNYCTPCDTIARILNIQKSLIFLLIFSPYWFNVDDVTIGSYIPLDIQLSVRPVLTSIPPFNYIWKEVQDVRVCFTKKCLLLHTHMAAKDQRRTGKFYINHEKIGATDKYERDNIQIVMLYQRKRIKKFSLLPWSLFLTVVLSSS